MFKNLKKRIENREPRKIWFWSLALLFVFCLFSYGYCVRGTIVNIVARQNLETEISTLNTKVLDLEAQYIKAKNAVTLELAQEMGFVAVVEQKFVIRKAPSQGLSLITVGRE